MRNRGSGIKDNKARIEELRRLVKNPQYMNAAIEQLATKLTNGIIERGVEDEERDEEE